MNKKIKNSLLLLLATVLTPVCIFGAIYTYTYDAFVSIGEATVIITHSQQAQVSPVNKKMVLIGTVTFSDTASIDSNGLKAVYTLEGVETETNTVTNIVALSDGKSYKFTCDIPFVQTSGNISYHFFVEGTVGSIPVSTATVDYVTSVVAVSANTINPSSSGGVILESGNQTAGNTSIEFVAGSFTDPQNIIIKQLDPNSPPLFTSADFGAGRVSETNSFIALYFVGPVSETEGAYILKPATLTLYYGDSDVSRLFMKYRVPETGKWITIESSVDTNMKTISAQIDRLGYYAVSTQGAVPDNDYRPVKRVVIMNQGTFKFENMNDGDKLKIFNVNGKKVREITSRGTYSSGFEWDGRKDDGSWAESGTYIYQLNIQGKDKLINGTIAFVK